jgi:hypothetical protein
MKQNKLVIVVLVVIALLFVLGLSSGVFRDKDNKDGELSMRKAENQNTGWMAWLDGVMEPFRKGLDRRRLSMRPDCQIGDQTYKLTGQRQECDIFIAAKNGAGVQKAVLSVQGGQVKVLVPYPDDEPCAKATRGVRKSLSKVKTSKAVADFSRNKPGNIIKPGNTPGGAFQQPVELSVIYPADQDEAQARCEVTGDVDLMVLAQGGTLRLKCKGCENNRTVTVTLK